mgnify:CR=1 FL=1
MNTPELPGERMKRLREERGLSVRDVAKLSENAFTHSYVSSLENNYAAWSNIGLDKLKGFARAYDMSIEDLIAFIDNRRPVQDETTLGELYKPVRTFTLTASPEGKGVMIDEANEITLLPDNTFNYELYKVCMSGETQPRLRLLVRRQSQIQAGQLIVCETKAWGVTIARVRAIKDKLYSLDDTIFGRSELFKDKELSILGVVVAETRLLE